MLALDGGTSTAGVAGMDGMRGSEFSVLSCCKGLGWRSEGACEDLVRKVTWNKINQSKAHDRTNLRFLLGRSGDVLFDLPLER